MPMTLDDWMTERKMTAEELGKTLDCSGQAVRRYRSGERMPDTEMAEKIIEISNGAVTVEDMHNARVEYLNKDLPGPDELRQAGAA